MMTVTITFSAPPRASHDAPVAQRSTVHKRKIEGLPRNVAQQMRDDFMRYNTGGDQANRYKIYQYIDGEDEIEIALDFHEIIDLSVTRT